MKRLVPAILLSLLTASSLFTVTAANAQDWARTRLEKSPRHQEWVKLKAGNRTLQCFLVYPEVSKKAPAILIIHEIFGLSDWARETADELASAGYIAIVPDLLSDMAPGGKGTAGFPNQDAVTQAVFSLPPAQVTGDLNTAARYASRLPACNGKLVVAGFCWGGGQAFHYASINPKLKAAFVFYGSPPETQAAANAIHCPVYGFYAGNDARISTTIPQTEAMMKKARKIYKPVVYPGAGHGFMRAGEAPDASPDNKKARDAAWTRWMDLLKTLKLQ